MAKKHNPGFLKLVTEAKKDVKEETPVEALQRIQENPQAVLLDIREESEWKAGHVSHARYLGRGVLERDIETQFPDMDTELHLYCGGGFRSALAARNLQLMGYRNVYSVDGGYSGLVEAGAVTRTESEQS